MLSRRRATATPFDDALMVTLAWRLWWVSAHASMGCMGCLKALLTEGPLHG